MKNINNRKKNSRFTIGINDEGQHKNEMFKMREWWYYNAYFNHPESELKNWSIILTIIVYPRFSVKMMVLFDDKNNNYGGLNGKPIEEIQINESGINVNCGKSFIKGKYPKWNIHFENHEKSDKEIIVDLEYKATKQPIWILKNTGNNKSTSVLGYYFIMNCEVDGKITIDNKEYNVKGVGYHDHPWMPIRKKKNKVLDTTKKLPKRFRLLQWDWIYILLDNEWSIFIATIHLLKGNLLSSLMPRCLIFVSKEIKIMESYFFQIKYKNLQKTSIQNIKIPKEINIKSVKINPLNKFPIKRPLFLNLNYKVENIKETCIGKPKNFGIWISSGKVTGKIKGIREEIELKGFGIMEHTKDI
jgi:hypothetical protein